MKPTSSELALATAIGVLGVWWLTRRSASQQRTEATINDLRTPAYLVRQDICKVVEGLFRVIFINWVSGLIGFISFGDFIRAICVDGVVIMVIWAIGTSGFLGLVGLVVG